MLRVHDDNEFACGRGLRYAKHRKILSALLVVVLTLTTGAATSRKRGPTVRTELASLQRETGLALAYFGWYVGTLDFGHRDKLLSTRNLRSPAGQSQNGDVSPHGTLVAFAWSYLVGSPGSPAAPHSLAGC